MPDASTLDRSLVTARRATIVAVSALLAPLAILVACALFRIALRF